MLFMLTYVVKSRSCRGPTPDQRSELCISSQTVDTFPVRRYSSRQRKRLFKFLMLGVSSCLGWDSLNFEP